MIVLHKGLTWTLQIQTHPPCSQTHNGHLSSGAECDGGDHLERRSAKQAALSL